MPGIHITDRQVRRYMESRKDGYTQAAAAARAGFSERTGGGSKATPVLPSQRDRRRRYRTRPDPFAEVWREELVPMLAAVPQSAATTLLEELQRRHPGRYPDGVLRSLQRRVAHWRATEGPERELIFRQEHPPGRQALSDFTDGAELGVTIAGGPFPHLLYHFWLAFSRLAVRQGDLRRRELHRADRGAAGGALAARRRAARASHRPALGRLSQPRRADDDEAARLCRVLRHYGLEPTRNNAGVAHENGSVEAAHGHLKIGLQRGAGAARLARLCRSRRLSGLPAGVRRAQERAARRTRSRSSARRCGRCRAIAPATSRVATVTVTRSGTITVRNVLYTVPSRLVGCRLKVHIYDDRLVCYLGLTPVLTVPRRHFKRGGPRVRVVDYRHLVGALVKKPQAFRHSVFREELSRAPSSGAPGRRSTERLDPRKACRVYVGLLHLAAMHACEASLPNTSKRCWPWRGSRMSRRRAPPWRRCRPRCQ